MIIGWYRTPVELLVNSFFRCCQNRFINGVTLLSDLPRILVMSWLNWWSTSTLDFCIPSFISSSFCSSSAHLSLCICSVSLIRSGAVCETCENRCAGSASFFCCAFWLSSDFFEYWRQLQHCSPSPSKSAQPRVLQYSWWGNELPSSSLTKKGSTDFGITWCTMACISGQFREMSYFIKRDFYNYG